MEVKFQQDTSRIDKATGYCIPNFAIRSESLLDVYVLLLVALSHAERKGICV